MELRCEPEPLAGSATAPSFRIMTEHDARASARTEAEHGLLHHPARPETKRSFA